MFSYNTAGFLGCIPQHAWENEDLLILNAVAANTPCPLAAHDAPVSSAAAVAVLYFKYCFLPCRRQAVTYLKL